MWKFWLQHPYLEVPLSPLLPSQTHCSSLECPLDGCAIAIYGFRNFVLVPVLASIQNILDLFSLLPHNHVWKDPANGGGHGEKLGTFSEVHPLSSLSYLTDPPQDGHGGACLYLRSREADWRVLSSRLAQTTSRLFFKKRSPLPNFSSHHNPLSHYWFLPNK